MTENPTLVLYSNELCCRVVFDGNFAPSPVGAYDHSLLIYTFGKSTLAPGERLGYIALSPGMPREDREAMRESVLMIIEWLLSRGQSRTCRPSKRLPSPRDGGSVWGLPFRTSALRGEGGYLQKQT